MRHGEHLPLLASGGGETLPKGNHSRREREGIDEECRCKMLRRGCRTWWRSGYSDEVLVIVPILRSGHYRLLPDSLLHSCSLCPTVSILELIFFLFPPTFNSPEASHDSNPPSSPMNLWRCFVHVGKEFTFFFLSPSPLLSMQIRWMARYTTPKRLAFFFFVPAPS